MSAAYARVLLRARESAPSLLGHTATLVAFLPSPRARECLVDGERTLRATRPNRLAQVLLGVTSAANVQQSVL